tara:strand:- start:5477 stop:6340 length:864 start_codon:yes stop_codon:yes gene_type:complete
MSRCLVTGHRGYIGSHLVKALEEAGHEVLGIDLVEGHDIKKDLKDKFHPHYYNFKPEYIFHLACFPRVAYSVENPVITMENNVLCTSCVLDFAKQVGAKRVIYSSSSSVVGNGNGPTSPYALQKLVSEMECKLYSDLYDLDTVSLRYFNVYSEDQTVDGPYCTAIANWMDSIRKGVNPYITGEGDQCRDMLHVSDAVRANIFAMTRKGDFNGEHYDIGTGTNISLNEIKEIVQKNLPSVRFDYVGKRKGDVLFTCAKTDKIKQLGWQTSVAIKEGINKCFERLKNEK